MEKPQKGTIRISVERYAYPRVTKDIDVPAIIVGDIAVHRRVFWGEDDYPTQPNNKAAWTATHIPTGVSAGAELIFGNNQKPSTLIDWAAKWQEMAPDFFALAANGNLGAVPKDIISAALEAGRKAKDALT